MLKDTAIEYAGEGLKVIPLLKDKRPMLSANDFPYLYDLMPDNLIDKYFNKAEMIGIACGEFEAIDFDKHKNQDINSIFDSFISDNAIKLIINSHNLPIIKTPSGGYHIYYKVENPKQGRKLSCWDDGSTMIETRGTGQYVATIPSVNYEQIRGTSLVKIATISEDEREYLLSYAESFSRESIKTENKLSGCWPEKWDTSTVWGKFNESCVDEAKDLLVSIGWEYVSTRKRDNVELWLRPGKEVKRAGSVPISATFGAKRNMFYNFSSSVELFDSHKGYTPFDIFIKIKHSGNKETAIKELEQRFGIIHYKPTFQKRKSDFPISVFPEFLKGYITELNNQNNFDTKVTSSALLWVISVLIGNRIILHVNDSWQISPVLWLMIIAERGSSKTHAVNSIISPLKKIDSESKKNFDLELIGYNPEDKTQQRPKFKQVLLEDGTREGYVKAMLHNPGGLGLVKDELHGWLSDMDKHSGAKGGDEAFWISSFNNTSYSKNIKGEDATFVDRMFIGLMGSIQPHIMDEISKLHTNNGMFDRFLLIPYDEIPFKFKLSKEKSKYKDSYASFVYSIHKILMTVSDQVIYMNDEAKDVFEQKYNEFLDIRYKSDNHNLRAYVAKIITYLPRLSVVFEIIDNCIEWNAGNYYLIVSKNSVLKAYDVLQFFISNAEDVLFDIANSEDFINIIKASGCIKRPDKARALITAMVNKEIETNQAKIADYLKMSKQQVNYIFKNIVNKSKQK